MLWRCLLSAQERAFRPSAASIIFAYSAGSPRVELFGSDDSIGASIEDAIREVA
jgi:hypothetical protein